MKPKKKVGSAAEVLAQVAREVPILIETVLFEPRPEGNEGTRRGYWEECSRLTFRQAQRP